MKLEILGMIVGEDTVISYVNVNANAIKRINIQNKPIKKRTRDSKINISQIMYY